MSTTTPHSQFQKKQATPAKHRAATAAATTTHTPQPLESAAAAAAALHAPPPAAAAKTNTTSTNADDHSAFADDRSSDVPLYRSFDEMPLSQHLLRGVYSVGFEKPSPIQQRAIVPLLQGGDIVAQAQSGTGKTGAFSIGLLQRIDARRRGQAQALVLSPTRELAEQTHEALTGFSTYMCPDDAAGPLCQIFVGGTRVSDDVKKIQAGCAVAAGTPGRVADLIRRGALRVGGLKLVVLDEADDLLSQGFSDQVHEIFKYLPRDVQVALFSATLPPDVLALSKRFMRDPTQILCHQEKLTLQGIKQFYVALTEEQKLETLVDLYESISVAQSVVFANRKQKVDWVGERLNAENHTVSLLHADMARGDRSRVMGAFKAGSSRVLVSTDIVARGIDVQHVNVVVNYDLPKDMENYLHRIGRSGRYGKKGIAINFVTARDVDQLRALEAHYHTQIEELPMDFASYLGEE